MAVAKSGTMSDRDRRARVEPLSAERIAPGMFAVSNLRSGSTWIVDIREGVCECPDFHYRSGKNADGFECKHEKFIKKIANGELCSHCGYERCRPSCPERGRDE
ncbi:hypothetical protein C5B90_19205 [Haloferax sp. Atlit-12N]|uniref:hypothetical protein n=1 Tax=unclassified Haloferax TaxID=2625095 RepID=UPI000E21DF6F|nr:MULTISPECIES: hypothetical protein [unclassified Haloferax]RDZ61402.1 hypothetical protein C5B90_19205 [Haloferax sp. Atlit-12N]